ncbi:hypothetical protein Csa_023366 [Cucumis sativus]|uniref:Uncharacterized protein n=1 Tax=Cucumis sativus TaxID=3659 RepID=A0A0A0LVE4_CUCSA|nr:hypothetical protein Csa_023366 [Cucumis sativus]
MVAVTKTPKIFYGKSSIAVATLRLFKLLRVYGVDVGGSHVDSSDVVALRLKKGGELVP